jgi:RimJ/RimL family protein N-acetyltransferase
MKLNLKTRIEGSKTILVPYREHHVIKYHRWMSDPELLTLTASEPLSLDEEYEMQKTWQNDENKLTFIVLNKLAWKNDEKNNNLNEIECMIGDVNAFLSSENDDNIINSIEIDVMISEKDFRSSGFGSEAVYLMMFYCLKNFNSLKEFIVKINDDNETSIKMFEKFGFMKYDYLKAFKQICLKFPINRINCDSIHKILNIEKFYNSNVLIDLNYV